MAGQDETIEDLGESLRNATTELIQLRKENVRMQDLVAEQQEADEEVARENRYLKEELSAEREGRLGATDASRVFVAELDRFSVVLETDRETIGRIVRDAWIQWAKDIAKDPKPGWVAPWEEMSEEDREADMCIGEAVLAWIKAETEIGGVE